MIGTVLSGYQIVAKIKDGSVGTVWKGRNPFNEDVAIKVLAAQHAREARKLKEFRNEAKITAQLKHPNIIRIIKFADVTPQPYVIMEYFNSENLKYALMNLPERVRGKEFRILRQICDALHAMHRQSIVHLDIKPENVLVSDGADVRLIDFSIAQQITWGRMLKFGKTKWGGTPAYMAPEQIRGEAVSPATDQYALGVLAYELFARRMPFLAPHPNGLLEKHLTEAPPPLRKFLPKTPPDVDRVILRMLEKNPANRWPDMTTVAFELNRLSEKWGVWWVDPATGSTARAAAHTARLMQPTLPPKSPAARPPARGEDVSLLKTHPMPAGVAMTQPGEMARRPANATPAPKPAEAPPLQSAPAQPPAAAPVPAPADPAGVPSPETAPIRPVPITPEKPAKDASENGSTAPTAAAVEASAAPGSAPSEQAPTSVPALSRPPGPADGSPTDAPASAPPVTAEATPAATAPAAADPGADPAKSAIDEVEALLEARLKRRLEQERARKAMRAEGGGPDASASPRSPHESDVNLPSVR